MGLETLQKEILRDAKKEADGILAEAEQEKRKLLAEANQERERMLDAAREAIGKVIEAEKTERLTSARLNAKRLLGEAKSGLVDQAVDEVWEAFKKFRNSAAYARELERLIKQGVEELGAEAVIHLNALDQKSEAARKHKSRLAAEALKSLGGVVVSSKDGKVRVDYTLEQLFAEQREKIRKSAYAELFGRPGHV